MTELLAYADRRSARPGDRVTLMISSDAPQVQVEVVRLLDGSPAPPEVAAPSEPLSPPVRALAAGALQRTPVGSRADLPLPAGWALGGQALLRCWFFATTPGAAPDTGPDTDGSRMTGRVTRSERRRQVIWAIGEPGAPPTLAAALVDDGRLAIELDGAAVAVSEAPIRARTWYGLLVAVDGATVAAWLSTRIGRWYTVDHTEAMSARRDGWRFTGGAALRLAAWRTDGPAETLNGKIASPAISVAGVPVAPFDLIREPALLPGTLVASWDPHLEPGTDVVVDVGPAVLHGRTVNLPTRGATGPFWSAADGTARLTPQHDAIHFHADDVGDLGWQPSVTVSLPTELASDIYALRLSAEGHEMHIPLFVRGTTSRGRVAFLVPTNTYLAYANHRMFLGSSDLHHYIATHPVEPNDRDTLVLEYPFLGRSLYDLHDDGSGVCLASWARPLVSFEPAARDFLAAGPRHFAADLYILGWLRRAGFEFDVLTDEDLQADGVDALRPYAVVVTGSHPEYWSSHMMGSLQSYLLGSGRLMYLGGNGFYWMTSFGPDRSYIEVRRGHQGTRAWDSDPGEGVHATTGEAGGLWRNLGLCPQALVGVGMAAQGWGGGRGYRRLPDSFDPRVAPFFEGIGPDEIIGDFGFVMCGAVGDEVDRMDRALGTPPHALHLATSQTLPDEYQLVVEEVRNMTPGFGGTICDLVRSDMVWFDLPGGGEVFSVGSVSWAAALGWDGGRNNVERLSTNVLGAFVARGRSGDPAAPRR